jgi:hypothetical protein
MKTPLLTCPRCETPNFSLAGLRGHRCDGVNRATGQGERWEKRQLTADEIDLAFRQMSPVEPPEEAS